MTVDLSQICFIDCETTGLDPTRHVPWEIAVDIDDELYMWNVCLTEEELRQADPGALRIGGFYERGDMGIGPAPKDQALSFNLDDGYVSIAERQAFAHALVRAIGTRHLTGMVPSFDERFVGDFCRRQIRPPVWHYHLIDVEPLVVGYLRGMANATEWTDYSVQEQLFQVAAPPWKSNDLSLAMSIDPESFDRHTAMGDVRWTKALYQAVMNIDG